MFTKISSQSKSDIQLMEATFSREIRRRGLTNNFKAFQKQLAGSVTPDHDRVTETTLKCRLHFPEQLLAQPVHAVSIAEKFTRDLYLSTINDESLNPLLDMIGEALDVQKPPKSSTSTLAKNPASVKPMQLMIQHIHATRLALAQAFRNLSTAEKEFLRTNLYRETTGAVEQGYTFALEQDGQKIPDLLERIDRAGLLSASRSLAALSNPDLIRQLAGIRREGNYKLPGVQGEVWNKIQTPDGLIIVGGDGPNVYHLDEMMSVCAIIDVGGNDTYIEGTTTEERPLIVILDAGGDDSYRGVKPGIQGGAILGASLLVDLAGNDSYNAVDVAQGSALAGVGMLIDYGGDDSYRADRRVQGQAVDGIGLLIDWSGNDRYRAALFGQGVGGPLGFGFLLDVEGDDQYFAGGKYASPYNDSPGFAAWSQGVGVGAKDIANGGIGVLLDGSGNDFYQSDYFSHGGGYWFGAGFARDFAGDDRRIGATQENFDGSQRTVQRYSRWGIGFGSHHGSGFVFDDSGNDLYHGNWASMAYAWDHSIAGLIDFHGDDQYNASGSGLAQAQYVSLAIFFDKQGNDIYQGQGFGEAEKEARNFPDPSSSFAMFLDYTGKDSYPPDLMNKDKAERKWAGGIFIDR